MLALVLALDLDLVLALALALGRWSVGALGARLSASSQTQAPLQRSTARWHATAPTLVLALVLAPILVLELVLAWAWAWAWEETRLWHTPG